MTDQQIKEERWTLTRLSAAINTNENCLAWLAKRRLIRNTYDCIICHQPATLVAYAQGIDGFRWSCRGCAFRESVRDDSFFSGSRIALEQLIYFEVPDRTAATLTQAITQHILPGTHIVSDGWAAYANIANINNGVYGHSIVIHQDNFVEPNDSDTHTLKTSRQLRRAQRQRYTHTQNIKTTS
ncbi:hypothetical protein BgiMline_015019 [Biomphalaria glabrata]